MSPFDDPRNVDSGFGSWLTRRHIDPWLCLLLILLCGLGVLVLYSASGQQGSAVISQAQRLAVGLVVMLAAAQAPPEFYRAAAPWIFGVATILLILVLLLGDSSKGARRWLDLGIIRFQPSEMMKLAMPMMVAAYLHATGVGPSLRNLLVVALIIVLPTLLIARQPDLGTSLLVAGAGVFALYLGGLRWRWIIGGLASAPLAAWLLWLNMHAYQKKRVMTFLDPSSDPLGAGYHITQSKIAIGSGGLFGKGWLNGTQANLDFLPESHTDFIFAVFAEETGLIGVLLLLTLYAAILGRGLVIALRAQDTFQRLLAGSLSLTFFTYVFINIGMVIGLLPVVGVPLPLMSFGGTSMVSLLAGFGILMSIQTHRKLISN